MQQKVPFCQGAHLLKDAPKIHLPQGYVPQNVFFQNQHVENPIQFV